ncbi:hypothetical protein JQ629_12715 [Bradyrhizobium sp. AUGA SZCCT0222]|nr:hypothetical protein [Bradyrhizobium sp. AUGA SZCCT0222]MBR1268373.1 hypothetical protein [Bradyrhizobium sp. AUGA SZCCT0222]
MVQSTDLEPCGSGSFAIGANQLLVPPTPTRLVDPSDWNAGLHVLEYQG